MSAAFRREGDDEHLEPKFERPIPVGPNLVTARGLRLIKERVAALQAEVAATACGRPQAIAATDYFTQYLPDDFKPFAQLPLLTSA